MADVTPTSGLGLVVANVKTLLAALDAFQAWTGTASAAAAEGHIYLQRWDPGAAGVVWPHAVVSLKMDGGHDAMHAADGDGVVYNHTYRVAVSFEAEPTVGDGIDATPSNYAMTLLDAVGGIIEDLEELTGTDGYAYVRQARHVAGPANATLADQAEKEFWWMEYTLFATG
jgi:hypothetical protein